MMGSRARTRPAPRRGVLSDPRAPGGLALNSAPDARLGARLGWIGALSFASGLPYFFFTETVPVWLAVSGMTIGAPRLYSSSATLPVGAQVSLGAPGGPPRDPAPLDPHLSRPPGSGHRGARGCRPRAPCGQLAAVLLLYVALSATQDIAIDAYTIETTHGRELGVANSVRIGGLSRRELREQRAAGLGRGPLGLAHCVSSRARGSSPDWRWRRWSCPRRVARRRTPRASASRSGRCSRAPASGGWSGSPCCSSWTSRRWNG